MLAEEIDQTGALPTPVGGIINPNNTESTTSTDDRMLHSYYLFACLPWHEEVSMQIQPQGYLLVHVAVCNTWAGCKMQRAQQEDSS